MKWLWLLYCFLQSNSRSPLSFFENRKKVPWFCKNSVLILEKSALFVCIYGLDSHLKCSFKSILDRRHQRFFPVWHFHCMSYMKRLSNFPCSKEPPLPRLRTWFDSNFSGRMYRISCPICIDFIWYPFFLEQ